MSGRITALEPQKHSSERVNVYLDGEFAFGLALSAAVSLHLGETLTDLEIAALKFLNAVTERAPAAPAPQGQQAPAAQPAGARAPAPARA